MTSNQEEELPEFHFGLPDLPQDSIAADEGVEMDPEREIFPEEAALLEAFYSYRPNQVRPLDDVLVAFLMAADWQDAPELHFGLPDLPEEFLAGDEGVEMDPEWEIFPEEAALLEASFNFRPRDGDELEEMWDEMMASMASAGLDFQSGSGDGSDGDEADPEMLLLEAAIFLEGHWEEL